MDKKHRHSCSLTVPTSSSSSSTVTAAAPASTTSSRRSLPHTSTSSPRRSASRKNSNSLNGTADLPRPASLVRVKEQTAMNASPLRTSDATWANDQLPRKGASGRPETPGTPMSSRRSATPDASAASVVNPSSALLQDLLKEQRASRGSRGSTADDADSQVPQTPDRCHSRARSQSLSQSQSQTQDDFVSGRQKKVNTALSAGLRQPREMGVREMDQYVSKMNKQNFDLKLEIFHRAQQLAALEKRLERMEELEGEVQRLRGLEDELQELRHVEEDNQRLRESNDELWDELDKRDQAVTEAVDLICELEARFDELEGTGDKHSSPSTASSSPSARADVTPRQRQPIQIPERTSSRQRTARDQPQNAPPPESRHLQRAPSFLREENKSTSALRGLYLPGGNPSRSVMSVITKSESLNSMNEATEPASPRLSALSECSDLQPEEVSDAQEDVEQSETASREDNSTTASSDTLGGQREREQQREHISKWIQPVSELSPSNSPKSPQRRNRGSMFEFSNHTPPEGDLNLNDPLQRVRMDGFFGGSRLPPTPDTMSTARATRTNRSNGSDQGDKEKLGLMKHRLGQSQSSGELTAGQSSEHSGKTGSVSSDSSRDDLSADGKAAGGGSPSSSTSKKHHRGASWQERSSSWSSLDNHGGDCSDEQMENGKDHHSARTAKRHTVNLVSSSPPLTPQDWVEAANDNPRLRKEGPRKSNRRETHSGTSLDSDLSSASQSSGAGRPVQRRRYSLDTAVYSDSSLEPTLDLCALEPGQESAAKRSLEDALEANSRRRNFRSSFLGRLANPRRLQPSPTGDAGDDNDGAPAPVIPKARNTPPNSTPAVNDSNEKPTSTSRKGPSPPAPTSNNRKTLPQPSTESNVSANKTAPKSVSANSKEQKQKRRGSIGIFGWMIGGNGKKAEPSSSSSSMGLQPHNAVRTQKAASRPSPRSAGAAPHTTPTTQAPTTQAPTTQATTKAAKTNDKNTSTDNSKQLSDAELARRPRYVERRARRS